MSESKHTPGPWVYRVHEKDIVSQSSWYVEPCESIPDGYPKTVVNLLGAMGGDDVRADSYLIAAAPDLLEALVMVRDADNDCRRDGLPTMPSSARAFIDAAIARVEGKP